MLLGLTEPTEGRAEVAGFDPLRDPLEVKRRVGYLPDQVGFYDGLSARDNLAYTGRLAGLSRQRDRRSASPRRWTGSGCPMSAAPGSRTFSQGMRQRLGLAEVLMKRPSVAILDEPTTALDPHSTQEFLEMIRGLKADGTAVLLSSHHLDQVQSVCDRVALFNRGRIALSGTVTELAGARPRRRPCHRCRGARRRRSPTGSRRCRGSFGCRRSAAERYRVDCQRDLRAEIARRLAPPRSSWSASISPRRASTRSTTAISRRRAMRRSRGSPFTGAARPGPARHGRRQGDRRSPVAAPACASSRRWCS